jgi:hypothetical protein
MNRDTSVTRNCREEININTTPSRYATCNWRCTVSLDRPLPALGLRVQWWARPHPKQLHKCARIACTQQLRCQQWPSGHGQICRRCFFICVQSTDHNRGPGALSSPCLRLVCRGTYASLTADLRPRRKPNQTLTTDAPSEPARQYSCKQ